MVLDSQGPVLVSEPRSSVEFSNDTGAMIHCSAHGSPSPRIDWLMGDGSPVLPIPHIREMLVNGSMYFLPFGAESYRHDVHSAVYRCQASNSVGKVLGREITVKAGESETGTEKGRGRERCHAVFLPDSLATVHLPSDRLIFLPSFKAVCDHVRAPRTWTEADECVRKLSVTARCDDGVTSRTPRDPEFSARESPIAG